MSLFIPREVVARILRKQIELRDDPIRGGGNQMVCHEIAAAGDMTYSSASRRLYQIMNPDYYDARRKKHVTQRYLQVGTVDKIFQALNLTHLWRVEGLDELLVPFTTAYPVIRKNLDKGTPARVARKCSRCGVNADGFTVGCRACASRRSYRRKALRVAPAVPVEPSPSRHALDGDGRGIQRKEAA